MFAALSVTIQDPAAATMFAALSVTIQDPAAVTMFAALSDTIQDIFSSIFQSHAISFSSAAMFSAVYPTLTQ